LSRVETPQETKLLEKAMKIRLLVRHRHKGPQILNVVTGQINPVLSGNLGQGLESQRTFQVTMQIYLR